MVVGKVIESHDPLGLRTRTCIGLLILKGALVSAVLAAPVAAQQEPSPSSEQSSATCRVYSVSRAEGPSELHASCSGRGLLLGQVTMFDTRVNEALGATLVDAYLGDARRILLLTIDDRGLPLVQHLNGQIARAAGRGPMSGIEDVELDLSQFDEVGELALTLPSERSVEIDLAAQVVEERARETARGAVIEE